MSKVQAALTVSLLAALALITAGVWLLHPAIALIVAGAGLASVAVVMASEVAEVRK